VIYNPIKAYFNYKLNMWISEEKETQVEENFDIRALDLYTLRELFLKNDINEILNLTEKKKILPLGILKKVAIEKITEHYSEYQNTLLKLGVNKSEIFDMCLDEECKEPLLKDNILTLPALDLNIDGSCVKIIGKISNVCPLGLVCYIDKKTNPLKVFVEFLILQCLIDHYHLNIQKQILGTKQAFTKSFVIENPFVELQKIICYYYSCQNALSPLNAEWLEELIEKDVQSFSKFLVDKLTNTYSKSYNHYLNWISRSATVNAVEVIENGKPIAKELFENFFALWNKK
jgi:exodeoxyribonuclease V gamma subunit